jgi:hypothetical protein
MKFHAAVCVWTGRRTTEYKVGKYEYENTACVWSQWFINKYVSSEKAKYHIIYLHENDPANKHRYTQFNFV